MKMVERRRRRGLANKRVEKGWSQLALALHLGVKPNTIQRWEAGEATPRAENRRVLAKALDVDLHQLNELLKCHVPTTRRTMMISSTLLLNSPLLSRDVNVDELRADLDLLLKRYPSRKIYPSYVDALAINERAWYLGERITAPKEKREAVLLRGVSGGVLANTLFAQGAYDEAHQAARVALLSAELSGHSGLLLWLRGSQALIAYWRNRFDDAIIFVGSDLDRYRKEGGSALIRLHCIAARAHAALGNTKAVDHHIIASKEVRSSLVRGDEFGGLMSYPLQKQFKDISSCRTLLGGKGKWAFSDAEVSALEAIRLYDKLPKPRIGEYCLTLLELAHARIGLRDLEGATQPIRQALLLVRERPTASTHAKLASVARLLAKKKHYWSPASDLRDEIIELVNNSKPRA